MRRVINLSADAVSAIFFVSRQRLRMCQHIPLSEIQSGLQFDPARVRSALFECVEGGWLLLTRQARREPCYSLIAARRRGAISLSRLLN